MAQKQFIGNVAEITPPGHTETLVDKFGNPDFRNQGKMFLDDEGLPEDISGDFNPLTGDIRSRSDVSELNDPPDTLTHEFAHKLFRDLSRSPRGTDHQVIENFRTLYQQEIETPSDTTNTLEAAFRRGQTKGPKEGLNEAFAAVMEIGAKGEGKLSPSMQQFMEAVLTGRPLGTQRDLLQGKFNMREQ